MFAKKKRAPMPKGQGAAAAKQMGLFVDFNPEEMAMAMEENLDDPDLEAELAALTGSTAAAGGRAKPKGRSPMPMEDIARMADECMRDLDDEEEDENLEDDEDLLAELQEVVGDEEAQDAPAEAATPVSSPLLEMSPTETSESSSAPQQSSSTPGSLQHTLEERIAMYKAAIQSTKASGEASKARRYDRGLKTLETMLTAAKKGRSVNEAEIPPPVATGAPSAPSRPAVPPRPAPLLPTEATSDPEQQEAPVETETTDDVPEIFEPNIEEEQTSSASQLPVSSLPSPVEQEEEPTSPSHNSQAEEVGAGTRAMLLERQKEYKMAALSAKKQGEAEKAKLYLRTSKRFDAVIQALEQGQPIDLSGLPPSPTLGDTQSSASVMEPAATQPVPSPPAAASVPAPPRDVLEALEQRRAKYVEASAQAKASGDERKARMHDRIAKQYQSAIRSHKAGKSVNFTELPVPPGFPPIPGQDEAGAEQGFAAVLEAANQLANTDATEVGDEDEEEEKEEESKPPVPDKPKKPMLAVPPTTSVQKRTPSPSPDRTTSKEGLSPTAIQQVEFLEGRRKQYMKAALQAKQKNDMDQAKQFLRTAKGFEPMIEAARNGKPVDISKVPSPPGDEDEEFVLVHHSEVQLSEKAEQVYTQLTKILKEQQEKCLTISKQFTHLGNIAETTKFEKLADRCKKSIEILRLSQARGLDPPTHHFEERTYNTVRIFPDLSSTEMVVMIVRGMNLPAPSGIQPNDLDAYVKFEFPYPSTEQPQKHKTAVIKNTNSPEYNQSFSLSINRNHRGFRRVVQNKGLKLEVLHKGYQGCIFIRWGFLRSDKPVGTVHVKLDKLETQSEVREIVEVMDGRKATGGRVEVRVRLREPLSGQDLQTVTERWLVLDHSKVLL